MLEYMLIRANDQPIVEKSSGLLRWIVLDEAHTYLGSNAAEISLLLRRVMNAFNVDPATVRFVATSATIGSGNSDKVANDLRKYLADLAGISPLQVDVITGRRVAPEIPVPTQDFPVPSPEAIEKLHGDSFEKRLEYLTNCAPLRRLRESLAERPLSLCEIRNVVGAKLPDEHAMTLLDLCSEKPPKESKDQQSLIPLRGNYFLRAQSGVWVCWNRACKGRDVKLEDDSWPFGAVFLNHRTSCQHCGSQVFEVVTCKDCGEVYLSAHEDDHQSLTPAPWFEGQNFDPFEIEQAARDTNDDDTEAATDELNDDEPVVDTTIGQQQNANPPQRRRRRELICSDGDTELAGHPMRYDLHTGQFSRNSDSTGTFSLAAREENLGRLRCVGCGEVDSGTPPLFFPMRVGPPFYLGVAIPILLEHTPPFTGPSASRPFEGRQLISFTDSRQGTARFASRMQIESERSYLRSYIYHKLWSEVHPCISVDRQLLSLLQRCSRKPAFIVCL
jgi:hypothetical protein